MTDTARLTAALASRYAIERELGAGGMATVYLAFDLKHHRKVAVKVLRPELAATLGADRFTQEIETVAQFQHPHILPLLDSGEASGFLYYVMPYVEGEPLRDRLARHGELPIHDAVKILVEIVDALAYAHAHGVAHRDIKPDNVLLSGRHALVMDFGVAKALSEATGRQRLTTAGIALGTPAYMAPEQAAADPHLDHRVDVYAVGALGYELIAGRPPFTAGTTQEVLAAHVSQAPEPVTKWRPACPPALAAIIMKCLEKRPADRWQTADELLAQLEPLATPSGGTTPTGMRLAPALAKCEPWLGRAAVAVGVLVVLGVAGAVLLRRRPAVLELRRRTQVTLDPGLEIDPALSPDGKLVAYVAGPPGQTRLFVRQVDGGAPVEVVREQGGQRFPFWTPDGRRILFQSARGIEIVPALGATPRVLVAGSGPGLVAEGGGVALQLAERGRPGRLSGRSERRGSAPRFPGSAHDRARRSGHQCLAGRQASRLRGVRGTVERLVAPRSPCGNGDRLDLASTARDDGQPDHRGVGPVARRRVARVRLRPGGRATDLSRPARRGRAGAADQRFSERVEPRVVARRPGDLIPHLPRGAAARVRDARRGRDAGAGHDGTGRRRERAMVARWPAPTVAREHVLRQPGVGGGHAPRRPQLVGPAAAAGGGRVRYPSGRYRGVVARRAPDRLPMSGRPRRPPRDRRSGPAPRARSQPDVHRAVGSAAAVVPRQPVDLLSHRGLGWRPRRERRPGDRWRSARRGPVRRSHASVAPLRVLSEQGSLLFHGRRSPERHLGSGDRAAVNVARGVDRAEEAVLALASQVQRRHPLGCPPMRV